MSSETLPTTPRQDSCVACGFDLTGCGTALHCPECGAAPLRRLIDAGTIDSRHVRDFARVMLAAIQAGRAAIICTIAWVVLGAWPDSLSSTGGHRGFLVRSALQLPATICVFVAVWLALRPSVWSSNDAGFSSIRRRARVWLPCYMATYVLHLGAAAMDADYAGLDTLINVATQGWSGSARQVAPLALLVMHLGVAAIGVWLLHGGIRSLGIALEAPEAISLSVRMRRWAIVVAVAVAVVLLSHPAQGVLGRNGARMLAVNAGIVALAGAVVWTSALWRSFGVMTRRFRDQHGFEATESKRRSIEEASFHRALGAEHLDRQLREAGRSP